MPARLGFEIDLTRGELLGEVIQRALLDAPRRKLLASVASYQAPRFPESDWLECGVWRGGSALILGWARARFMTSGCLHLCDSWQVEFPPRTERDELYLIDVQMPEPGSSPEEVEDVMKRFGFGGFETHRGWLEDTIIRDQIDGPFAFAHLDVDIYSSMKNALDLVLPRMAPGGLIVIDDYGGIGADVPLRGVRNAVRDVLSSTPGWSVIDFPGNGWMSAIVARNGDI